MGRRPQRRTAPPLNPEGLPEPAVRFDLDTAPHTTRITGVGGTGIVTVSQILAAVAGFAGREIRTLDQIGLAQKGGAVVSDVKISASPLPAASKAAAGECDLYLGCDLLVAADPKNLTAADAGTVAVVSITKVPTGRMITDPGSAFPTSTRSPARSARRPAGATRSCWTPAAWP
jgi:indolepyruvate ferredoxin oxidoreductase